MDTEEQLFDHLSKLHNSRTLVLTIGNILKGDDAVGPIIYQQLKGKLCVEIIDAGTVPENYIQSIIKKAPQNLLIIDAIDSGVPPGAINIFKPDQLNSLIISTHTLSPDLFVNMIAKAIDVDVYIIGVQPAQIQLGEPVSAEVSRAIQKLTRILTEIFARD